MRVAFVLRSVEVQPLFQDLCEAPSPQCVWPLPILSPHWLPPPVLLLAVIAALMIVTAQANPPGVSPRSAGPQIPLYTLSALEAARGLGLCALVGPNFACAKQLPGLCPPPC